MRTTQGILTGLTAATAALLLAACGSSDDGTGAAGQPDDAKRLAFAKCMRAAGVDFQDEGGGGEERTTVRVGKGVNPDRVAKIQAGCAKQTGGGPKEPSKEDQAKFLDQALKFSRCMRAHGIDLPDPKAGGGGIVTMRRAPGGVEIDPGSPVFQRAQKACESYMPGGRNGGPTTHLGGGSDGPVSAGRAAP